MNSFKNKNQQILFKINTKQKQNQQTIHTQISLSSLQSSQMGNCQDQFQNVSQYDTENDKSQVLIDRSHKRIFASKYEKNVGFIMNQEDKQPLDNQVLHKSIAISRNSYVQKSLVVRKKHAVIETPKLQLLSLSFYHSLGLPEYSYHPKPAQMTEGQGKAGFIHEAEDITGVIYVGQRNAMGLFHGNGILKANTVHYIGQFYQGTKHNHGREIYTNQVYEGEFQFDFRKGKGVRYTEGYVDEGEFDRWIVYGVRKFKNGNRYEGTFQDNKMHTFEDGRSHGKCTFYDASNDLDYENLVMREEEMIKANTVKNHKTNRKIGCFIGHQIIREDDERYERVMRNWDELNVLKYVEVSDKEKHLREEEIIRKRIAEWE